MIHHVKRWLRDRERERVYLNKLNKDPLYDDSTELRMYVIVRDDVLPPMNQGIQALHAIMDYALQVNASAFDHFEQWAVHHKTVVLLGGDENAIGRAEMKAMHKDIPFTEFREPDLNNMVTAVAFEPMVRAAGKDLFWGLRRAQ